MNFIFFGTPDYVLPVLDTLNKKLKSRPGDSPVVAVVTQKPKPVGRKQTLEYSQVDKWAHKRGVPVLYDPFTLAEDNISADIGILASYGKIIPKYIINRFKYGILNIHPSLLPKWRGASPVQASLISNEMETGVTIIKLDDKLDHGPIVSRFKETVLNDDTTDSLRSRLFQLSAEFLSDLIPAYIKGKINLKSQDDSQATYTQQLTKQDGFIPPSCLTPPLQGLSFKGDWKIPFMKDFTAHYSTITINNFIRAMYPWPTAWTYVFLNEKQKELKTEGLKDENTEELENLKTKKHKKETTERRLKILSSHLEPTVDQHPSKTSNLRLVLDEVQLEGKSVVSWNQFLQGYPNATFES